MSKVVFETERLTVRVSAPTDHDIDFLHTLWTTPEVMTNVGYPRGLQITRDNVREQLTGQGTVVYRSRLLAFAKSTGECIGECMLSRPGKDGVSETDVKLMPKYWGRGYGTEIKRGLVDYLFTHTNCRGVRATPNRSNVASQRMQEAVGARRVGEGVFEFPESMRGYTSPVYYYEYLVTRVTWIR